jgi:hypothetical protein
MQKVSGDSYVAPERRYLLSRVLLESLRLRCPRHYPLPVAFAKVLIVSDIASGECRSFWVCVQFLEDESESRRHLKLFYKFCGIMHSRKANRRFTQVSFSTPSFLLRGSSSCSNKSVSSGLFASMCVACDNHHDS